MSLIPISDLRKLKKILEDRQIAEDKLSDFARDQRNKLSTGLNVNEFLDLYESVSSFDRQAFRLISKIFRQLIKASSNNR